MGLWQRLREARDANRQDRVRWAPTGPDDLSGAQVLFQSYGDGSDREPILPTMVGLANNAYAGSSVVFSLIAVRMLLFAEAVPRWWDKDKRRFEAATDGLDLLMYPWPGADHAEMQARAELDVSLAGNAFIAHPKDLDRLVRLRPDWVTIQRVQRVDSRGRPYIEVDGYWYGQPGVDDDWVFYDVDEVAHYAPYPDPLADFRGMSWLTPVVREVSHDHAMTEYATKFFDHAAPQPLDAKILTPSGWSTMGQMRVGSEVIGSDGKPHPVVGVYPQGERDIYRVTFSDGTSAESTEDHIWAVQSAYDVKRGVTRTMSLRQIVDAGLRYDSGSHKWSVPFVDPVQFDGPDGPLPLDPYLLGSLLGDGCFGTNGRGSGVVSMAFDTRDMGEQLPLLRLPDGVSATVRVRGGHSAEVSFVSEQYRNPLLAAVRDLGLFGVTGVDKFVPEQYMTASPDDRLALLQGLMDTDGHAGATSARFTNNSPALAQAVVDLVGSLGGTARIEKPRVREGGRVTYSVTVKRLPDGMVPFRLPRKAAAYRPPSRVGRRRFIVGVEKVRRAEAQCISVDVEDHLYVTDDYILTHNTPNMIVKYSQNLGPEKLRQARETIAARHGGMENAYKAMILDSGADVTIAGNSFEQMGFNALRAATENRIASASGVPPMIPGFKEGLQAATLANYDAASRRLADMTMRPLWRSFASELRKIVQPPRKVGWERDKLELRFDASEVAALQEGKQAAADTFKTKALTAGELIRSGYDPKSVGDAVDAQDMSLLVHTEKTPTALYDEEGNQVNKKQGEDDGGDGEKPKKAGQPGGPKVQQGQGAAAPQPARSVIEEDELRPDDVQRLMEAQRDAMLEAFRSGLEAGRLTVREVDDDSMRHPGHPDQKVHGRKGAGSGTSGSGDSKDDPIRTSDPAVAAKALYEDKYVEFTSQRAVSTSLNKLKQMIDEAQARGEDKGKLNLCKASMAGTNLFCAENKGIPRVQMPQLSGKPKPGSKADGMEKNAKGEVNLGPAFREHLASKGIKITDDEVDSSVLKATQNELETRKVLGIAQAMRDGKIPEARIFVTNDDYVVDGHHRWAAKVTNEFVQGQDLMQQVAVIDTDIITVLAEANSFALDMGIPPASIGVKGRSVVQPTSDLDLDAVLVESALGRALIEWMHGA